MRFGGLDDLCKVVASDMTHVVESDVCDQPFSNHTVKSGLRPD